MIKMLSDLEVYQISFNFAMEVFNISRAFPKEERYSLTDQIVRSSRSITSNIAEGWEKELTRTNSKNTSCTQWDLWKKLKFGCYLRINADTFRLKNMICYSQNATSWVVKFINCFKNGRVFDLRTPSDLRLPASDLI